ncbi:serine threonine protein kinase [Moniliophthora roreri MCA 2997]|uniref:non-specific serine/threonine protein kinase n=1 Tax=Moniliophthora roreri (strain MCA 2997) TaxID=1381753 RepID=V2XYF9_MONRO|nr:serine threonine protein kinase [Moniliophthora roreri MCA 2997]
MSTPSHPPLGTLIDDDSLELVEVLGVGGYGVVYRAEDVCSASPRSYAVKCLMHNYSQSARQRQAHIREIALHQIAGAHPNVVTLHRVLEDYNCTYIIMDYATDHDLFSQILHKCRYLGDDYLIKHVFMQILDAVEYCHQLGIYHRDLKPENILCFDGGLRVAVTDFGLATTDKYSEEYRTGSIYHMSPECQSGDFAPGGSYSPMFNDIWSLGIILLNLATGRNPWKSASMSDPTFQAYLRDPLGFLPTVLPISQELNAVLVRMLEVDWRERMTLPELRQAIEEVDTFYSEDVVFGGSMARCPWEPDMEADSGESSSKEPVPATKSQATELRSRWSQDSSSDSDIIFADHSPGADSSYVWYYPPRTPSAVEYSSSGSDELHYKHGHMDEEVSDLFLSPRTPPPFSSPSVSESVSSFPITPNSFDTIFGARVMRKPLVIDTNCGRPAAYYNHEGGLDPISATSSSLMKTAVEYIDPSSAIFHPNELDESAIVIPQPVRLGDSMAMSVDDKELVSPTIWGTSSPSANASTSSGSVYSSMRSTAYTTTHISFNRSHAPSPSLSGLSSHSDPQLPSRSQPPFPSFYLSNTIDLPARPLSPTKRFLAETTRFKTSLFTPLKFFPRFSMPPPPSSAPATTRSKPTSGAQSEIQISWPVGGTFLENNTHHMAAIRPPQTDVESSWMDGIDQRRCSSEKAGALVAAAQDQSTTTAVTVAACRKAADYFRSPRHWFFPSKLFSTHHAQAVTPA